MRKIILLIFLIICFLFLKKYYQVKFRINQERIGFMILKGGYRAWWIRYSEGVIMTTPPKILWCFPRYEHCDIRPFLKKNND